MGARLGVRNRSAGRRHVEWTEAALPPNQLVAYDLTLSPTRDRNVVLRADIDARGVDPEPGNNRVSVPVTIG